MVRTTDRVSAGVVHEPPTHPSTHLPTHLQSTGRPRGGEPRDRKENSDSNHVYLD